MDRALKTIRTNADRTLVLTWAMNAPVGTRVRFERNDNKRSLPQNALMWAMLTDVAHQARHMGRRYTTEQWKALFMHACGREVQFLQSLDGSTFIPWGQHSSDLSKAEMSELIDFIAAWGTEHGVVFHDQRKLKGAA